MIRATDRHAEIARPDNVAPDQTEVLEHCWIEGAPSRVVLDGYSLLNMNQGPHSRNFLGKS